MAWLALQLCFQPSAADSLLCDAAFAVVFDVLNCVDAGPYRVVYTLPSSTYATFPFFLNASCPQALAGFLLFPWLLTLACSVRAVSCSSDDSGYQSLRGGVIALLVLVSTGSSRLLALPDGSVLIVARIVLGGRWLWVCRCCLACCCCGSGDREARR